jgi:hypothetical protein
MNGKTRSYFKDNFQSKPSFHLHYVFCNPFIISLEYADDLQIQNRMNEISLQNPPYHP